MINNLINFIETLKVGQILFAFGIYLLFLWLLVPIWVYLDAKKKFKNDMLAMLLFMLVLPLNIPGLLFYIIIRPEDDIYEDVDDDHVVNIPIVNFVSDKNDLVLGFEIKLNGNIIKDDMARDINLKVDLDHGKDVEFKEAVKAIKDEVEEDTKEITNAFGKIVSSVKSRFNRAEKKIEDAKVVKEVVETKAEPKKEVSDKKKEGGDVENRKDSDGNNNQDSQNHKKDNSRAEGKEVQNNFDEKKQDMNSANKNNQKDK